MSKLLFTPHNAIAKQELTYPSYKHVCTDYSNPCVQKGRSYLKDRYIMKFCKYKIICEHTVVYMYASVHVRYCKNILW